MAIIEKVLASEEKDVQHDLELNRLERERRSYNFRISKMPENQKEENCVNLVADFIWSKKLTRRHRSIDEVQMSIEYAYRIGKKSQDFSRQIVVKMFSKPDRDDIVINARKKPGNQFIRPIFFQDDLSPVDYNNKREGNALMKEAHDKNLEPKFRDGIFAIKAQDETLELTIEDIRKYNHGMKLEDLVKTKQIQLREKKSREGLNRRRNRKEILHEKREAPTRRSPRAIPNMQDNINTKDPELPTDVQIVENPMGSAAMTAQYIAKLENQLKGMKEMQKKMVVKSLKQL